METFSMFDIAYEKFTITNKIRLIELFAGTGSQAMALRNLGADFEHHRVVEWDKYAMLAYNAVHGTNFTTSDITKVKGEDLGITDTDQYTYIMTYSFPCFTKDTLVLTERGYEEISNIRVGDRVLTHTNKYREVSNVMQNGSKEIWEIKGMSIDKIKTTENHRFYVREMYRKYPRYTNGKRGSERHFKAPTWKECKDLTKKDYMGIAINQKSRIPKWGGVTFSWEDGRKSRHKNQLSELMNSESFWWLIGRYIGDGWVRQQGGIIICCAKGEEVEIIPHLNKCGLNYNIVSENTVMKIHIPLKELSAFVSQFGRGATNKELTSTVIDLPVELLRGFIEGYVSADGSIMDNGLYKIGTVSKKLAYGIGQCVAKVYKTPYRIYKHKRKNKTTIDSRVVNQSNDYQIVWKLTRNKQDKAFYESGYVWFPIQNIVNTGEFQEVYDITVETDHSFTANGVIAHNCQDLSLAGKRAGMTKGSSTRSGLLWEVERLLKETDELPQVLLMENVPQVIGKGNLQDFREWQYFLESLGYMNYTQVLNAKHYGVAQNRERCFMVSLLGEYSYNFPEPVKLTKTIADYLEDEVDEKFYIKGEKADKLIEQLIEKGQLGTEKVYADGTINDPETKEISNCLTAKDRGIRKFKSEGGVVVHGSIYIDNSPEFFRGMQEDGTVRTLKSNSHDAGVVMQVKRLGNIYGEDKGTSYAGNVFDKDGLSPTLNTMQGGNREPMIVASRGRNPENPSDRTAGNYIEQRLEPNSEGICNTLTSVQKDNYVLEPVIHRIESPYRIRKLTPKECWRLMAFTEEDFHKAEKVVSSSQLYKIAGNSIVVKVLEGIFKEMME